jgi:hypothetical protein
MPLLSWEYLIPPPASRLYDMRRQQEMGVDERTKGREEVGSLSILYHHSLTLITVCQVCQLGRLERDIQRLPARRRHFVRPPSCAAQHAVSNP